MLYTPGLNKLLIFIRFLTPQLKVYMSNTKGKSALKKKMQHNHRILSATHRQKDPIMLRIYVQRCKVLQKFFFHRFKDTTSTSILCAQRFIQMRITKRNDSSLCGQYSVSFIYF